MEIILRLLLALLLLAVLQSGCSRPNTQITPSGTQTENCIDNSDIEKALRGLRDLQVKGPSAGGPYVGIGYSEAVDSVIAQGEPIVPHLIKRLDVSDYAESVYIVFCLRALQAKSAKEKIKELQKSEIDGTRFGQGPHDATLRVQIKTFLRDVDIWK